jgi:hypothetical protein
MDLNQIDSGALVRLKIEDKQPIEGKLHKIYGHIFIEVFDELYVLDIAGRFFFMCRPWIPYTQLPAKGWEKS